MEKLLFKKERSGARTSILTNFKSLFVPLRYAPLHKEGFKNRKPYLGLKIKCKFETGLRSKKCKLKSGRDIGHFMADLITNNNIWNKWKGQMPVIYNKGTALKD